MNTVTNTHISSLNLTIIKEEGGKSYATAEWNGKQYAVTYENGIGSGSIHEQKEKIAALIQQLEGLSGLGVEAIRQDLSPEGRKEIKSQGESTWKVLNESTAGIKEVAKRTGRISCSVISPSSTLKSSSASWKTPPLPLMTNGSITINTTQLTAHKWIQDTAQKSSRSLSIGEQRKSTQLTLNSSASSSLDEEVDSTSAILNLPPLPSLPPVTDEERNFDPSTLCAKLANVMARVVDNEGVIKEIKGAKGVTCKILKNVQHFAGNGQVHITTFAGENVYNGPKTQDFLDRQQLILEAAKKHIINNNNIENPDSLIIALKNKFEESKREIIEKTEGMTHTNFSDNYETCKEILKECVNECVNIIKNADPEKEIKDIKKELQRCEAEWVKEQGRPTHIHKFMIGGRTYIHMQEPWDRNTTPSMTRDQQGLVNYVTTSFFRENKDGSYTLLFRGVRHSSIPPIKIEDKKERMCIAKENVKQIIQDTCLRNISKIKDKIPIDNSSKDTATPHEGEGNENQKASAPTINKPPFYKDLLGEGTKDSPFIIDIRSLTLFTAKNVDWVRNRSSIVTGEWKGESESLQLKETREAMESYHNQPTQVTIKIGDEDKKVWVSPQFTLLNFGANSAAGNKGLMAQLDDHPIQNEINREGVVRTTHEVLTALKESTSQFTELFPDTSSGLEFLNEEKYKNFDDDAKAANWDSTLRKKDKNKYDQLEKGLKKDWDEIKSNLKNLIKPSSGEVDSTFSKGETPNTEVENKQTELTPEEKWKNEYLEKREEFVKSFIAFMDLYTSKEYATTDKVMSIQVAYLRLEEALNNFVEFNCKSAEDRTGNVENELLTDILKRDLERDNPPVSKEKVARTIMEQSVCRANTAENSRAAGLQVGYQVNMEGLKEEVKNNKAMSLLAKSIYE